MDHPWWLLHAAVATLSLLGAVALRPPWRWRGPLLLTAAFAAAEFVREARGEGPVFGALAFGAAALAGLAPLAVVAAARWAFRREARSWLRALLVAATLALLVAALVGFDLWASRARWRACNQLAGDVPFAEIERHLLPRGGFLPLRCHRDAGAGQALCEWGLIARWRCAVDDVDGRAHADPGSG